jgi:hypothetical protein
MVMQAPFVNDTPSLAKMTYRNPISIIMIRPESDDKIKANGASPIRVRSSLFQPEY